jgi:hypothetical protein
LPRGRSDALAYLEEAERDLQDAIRQASRGSDLIVQFRDKL